MALAACDSAILCYQAMMLPGTCMLMVGPCDHDACGISALSDCVAFVSEGPCHELSGP